MDTNMIGRTVLVTGGSLGIGRAIGAACYAAGARVALVARRQGPLDEACQALGELAAPEGAAVRGFACDVADGEAVEDVCAAVESAFGAVDVLVNNAGQSAAKPLLEISDAEWQADIDLKLLAAVRFARRLWPAMEAQRWGRIINLLNVYAKAPGAGTAPTSVTRAAGMALTKVLSAEGAPHNILVNALLIGFIKSDQIRRRYEASGSEQSLDEFVAAAGARLPMGRMGEAEEVANLALFLASEGGSYVTGCAINMDGGLSRVP